MMGCINLMKVPLESFTGYMEGVRIITVRLNDVS